MKAFLDSIIAEYESGIEDAEQVQEEPTFWFSRKRKPLQCIGESPLFKTFVTGEGGDSYTKEFFREKLQERRPYDPKASCII